MKNILISGASKGIGQSLALAYSKKGINLFLCARSFDDLLKVKQECELRGARVFIKSLDVSDADLVKNFIDEIECEFEIDLVIANAGISGGFCGSAEKASDVSKIISINLGGVLNLINPLIEKMRIRKSGQIVLISSLASFLGIPSSPAYSASKAAIRVYGEGLRGNLKQFGINVSVVCPGYVETEMTQKNNFWMPFKISSDLAAKIIKKEVAAKKGRIAFPKPLYWAICLGLMMPRFLIDFAFEKISRKQTKNLL